MSDAILSSDDSRPKRWERKAAARRSFTERFKKWWSEKQAARSAKREMNEAPALPSWTRKSSEPTVQTEVAPVEAKPAPKTEPVEPTTDNDKALDLYNSPDAKASRQRHKLISWLPWISLVLVIGIAIWWGYAHREEPDNKPTPSAAAVAPTPKEDRDPRFVQKDVGVGDLNRVIGKGLVGDNADEYTQSMLENAGHSAAALAVYAHEVGLWDDPNNTAPLLTPDKTYLSDTGIGLWHALKGAVEAKGTDRKVAEAPANGYNTGFANGKYGSADIAGIRGDRTALYITLRDGSVLIVMRRCGNPVHPGRPNLPVVPTDNPPPPRLTPKDASQDPAPRGNAPVGGGRNEDPGPGRYVPPSQMEQPPATTRVNPPAPAPAGPPAGSTPDPTPAPTPEVGAPTPQAPATGYSPPPGG